MMAKLIRFHIYPVCTRLTLSQAISNTISDVKLRVKEW